MTLQVFLVAGLLSDEHQRSAARPSPVTVCVAPRHKGTAPARRGLGVQLRKIGRELRQRATPQPAAFVQQPRAIGLPVAPMKHRKRRQCHTNMRVKDYKFRPD